MSAYVLEEYKDLIFPEKKEVNKFEEDHKKALALKKAEEEADSRDLRKKILQMADFMSYDDDMEESQFAAKF